MTKNDEIFKFLYQLVQDFINKKADAALKDWNLRIVD
ncbi:MAG: hypothetical protein Ct9H90mP6_10910 [Gammaproteobacteria bacterium]|nr:MAG: hypothetical protein Ct9H90mP6_10910 [Gammaproteobacteria bacterium]